MPKTPLLGWRLVYVAGLLIGGTLVSQLPTGSVAFGASHVRPWALATGALLVGLGTRMGGGCTSGHGLCGLARLSPRSLVSVLVFMATAMLTASAVQGLPSLRSAVLQQSPLQVAHLLELLPNSFVVAARSLGLSPSMTAAAAVALSIAGIAVLFRSVGQPAAELQAQLSYAPSARVAVLSLLCAVLFAVGLAVAGMTNPARLTGFLAPLNSSGWDLTLMFVMGAGAALNMLLFTLVSRAAASSGLPVPCPLATHSRADASTAWQPRFVAKPSLLADVALIGPRAGINSRVDARQVAGAAIFGAGWGLCCICPGPGLVGAGALQPASLLFLPFMALGMAAWEAARRCSP